MDSIKQSAELIKDSVEEFIGSEKWKDEFSNTPWKNEFDWDAWNEFFWTPNMTLFFTVGSILYIPLVFLGLRFMRDREPFSLRWPLLIWNAVLSTLSGIGFYHTFFMMRDSLMAVNSLQDQICNHQCFTHRGALYVWLFNATKIIEWTDTLFLILKKRPVIFLHWFHHITTMLYCWHATLYSYKADCSGAWFASMNMFVHWIMYGYYGLRTLYSIQKKRFTLFPPWIITILQITQMVWGSALVVLTSKCEVAARDNWHGLLFCGGMYSVYMILFVKILIGLCSGKKKKGMKKKVA